MPARGAMTMANRPGFPQQSRGPRPCGLALTARDQGTRGIALIQRGCAAYRSHGGDKGATGKPALLARHPPGAGQTTEGLVALAEALST